jgi:hypothetical protein
MTMVITTITIVITITYNHGNKPHELGWVFFTTTMVEYYGYNYHSFFLVELHPKKGSAWVKILVPKKGLLILFNIQSHQHPH